MAKVTIKRRNESERADGRAALYAVLNIERIKIRLPLDIAVTSAEWDPVAERIKGRGQEVKDKNLIISNTKAKISDILVRARLTGEALTKESFMALYRRPGETMNFNDFADRHLEQLRNALQPETLRHHKAALKKTEGTRSGSSNKRDHPGVVTGLCRPPPEALRQQSRHHTKKYVCYPYALLRGHESR